MIWQWRLNLPANIQLYFAAMRQMTAVGQSNKMASDMEVRMKRRCVTEFLHAEKIAPKDIHRRLLNVYGDVTVDVSTVRRWVVRFSSGDSNVQDTAVALRNKERLDQLIRANRRVTAREMYTELNISFNALETMVITLDCRKVCAR